MCLVELVAHGMLPCCLSISTVAVVKCMHQHAGLFHEEGQPANDMARPFGQVDRLTPLEGDIAPGREWS